MFFTSGIRPIGLNARNNYIRRNNPKESILIAKSKIDFKRFLVRRKIATPNLYCFVENAFAVDSAVKNAPAEFVIKPNKGSRGSGILVLQRDGENFVTPGGRKFTPREIKSHVRKILEGQFSSNNTGDTVLFEEKIYSADVLMVGGAVGLPDIRIFCHDYKPIMAMLRLPTKESGGKANLSQGAWGVGIDVDTGWTTTVYSKTEKKYYDGALFDSFFIPNWEEIKDISAQVSKSARLKISGVDIVLNENDKPLVLEVNGHPGIEIQNVNRKSIVL